MSASKTPTWRDFAHTVDVIGAAAGVREDTAARNRRPAAEASADDIVHTLDVLAAAAGARGDAELDSVPAARHRRPSAGASANDIVHTLDVIAAAAAARADMGLERAASARPGFARAARWLWRDPTRRGASVVAALVILAITVSMFVSLPRESHISARETRPAPAPRRMPELARLGGSPFEGLVVRDGSGQAVLSADRVKAAVSDAMYTLLAPGYSGDHSATASPRVAVAVSPYLLLGDCSFIQGGGAVAVSSRGQRYSVIAWKDKEGFCVLQSLDALSTHVAVRAAGSVRPGEFVFAGVSLAQALVSDSSWSRGWFIHYETTPTQGSDVLFDRFGNLVGLTTSSKASGFVISAEGLLDAARLPDALDKK
jgi:hypothetical protein